MQFLYSCLFVSAVLSAHLCQGQFITGRVSDMEGHAVPYATLSLMRDGQQFVQQADSAGDFRFHNRASGTYHLQTYALGYEKKVLTFDLNGDTSIAIRLQPVSQFLKRLTVVGNKPDIIRKADRVIFDLSNSVSTTGSNGLDVLGKVPGIQISGNNIAIAGKGAVHIMQDNRLLQLSGESLVRYLKSLSASQIAKIEIITHPSARYDAEGSAGLINMVTKRGTGNGISGSIQASLMRFMFTDPPDYGVNNYGYGKAGADLNYNTKRLSAYGSLSYRTGRELEGYGIDVYYPGRHWAMQDTGDYKIATFNLLAGIDYALTSKTTLGLGYQFKNGVITGADHIKAPVYDGEGEKDSVLHTYAVYRPVDYSNAFNLHWIQAFGESGGKLTINADYFNYYRRDGSDFESYTSSETGSSKPGEKAQYYDTTLQNIGIYTLKADVEIPMSFASLQVGGKLSFINNYSNIYYYDKAGTARRLIGDLSNEYRYLENTQSLYISGQKEVGKWKFRAGIRGEVTQTTGTSYFTEQEIGRHYFKAFPSVLVTYKVNESNAFSLAYDKRIHRPVFWDLNPYKSLMTVYSYVEGNPYLQPEYISNIELTHRYKNLLHSSLYFSITNNGFAKVTYAAADSRFIHTTPLNCIQVNRVGLSEALDFHPFHWLESNNQVNVYYAMVQAELPYIDDINGWGAYIGTNNTVILNRTKTFKGFVNFWCQFPEINDFGRSATYYKLDLGLQASLLQDKLDVALSATDVFQSSGSVTRSTVNQIRQTFTNFQVFSNIKIAAVWHFGYKRNRNKTVETGNESERSRAN